VNHKLREEGHTEVNSYNNQGGGVRFGSPLTDGVKILLVWNGIFYLLQHFIVQRFLFFGLSIEQLLGTVPRLIVERGFIWQLVTYMFLHGNFTHILFNMFALWMFGSDIERLYGTRKFLYFYFFTGIGAGILTVVFSPDSIIPTVGASGAIYGLLMAFAYYFPERKIYLYFLFPIPVRIFVIVFGAFELMSSINSQPGDSVAHIAHLGGLVFGWVYIKWIGRMIDEWERKRRRRHLNIVDSNNDDFWGRRQ